MGVSSQNNKYPSLFFNLGIPVDISQLYFIKKKYFLLFKHVICSPEVSLEHV